MELISHNIVELTTVLNFRAANELLKKGWVLLSTGAVHTDSIGYQSKTYFTLALLQTEELIE